jgi:hypothetical protein
MDQQKHSNCLSTGVRQDSGEITAFPEMGRRKRKPWPVFQKFYSKAKAGLANFD